MLRGRLIVESLRPDAELTVPELRMIRLLRTVAPESVTGTQPPVWTLFDFEAPDRRAQAMAAALAGALLRDGWYADFRTDQEHYVVFADHIFTYTRGDAAGRDEAAAYGRSVGVPEEQLDWEATTIEG